MAKIETLHKKIEIAKKNRQTLWKGYKKPNVLKKFRVKVEKE